jgi:hypothetical protein
MNKKFRKLLCVALCFVTMLSVNTIAFAAEAKETPNAPVMYEITVGETTRLVAEGEKVSFSMESLSIRTNADEEIIEGDAGTLTVWGSGKYFYWEIDMSIPATSFSGYVSGTNLTTGASVAGGDVTGFSGSYAIASVVGNRYSASLSGTAYLGPIAVAKTGYNSVTWTR